VDNSKEFFFVGVEADLAIATTAIEEIVVIVPVNVLHRQRRQALNQKFLGDDLPKGLRSPQQLHRLRLSK
jgi:hypothetical protein